jgi:heme oxygenase
MGMTPTASVLLAALRAATAPAHDRIEALLQLDRPIGLGRYGSVLRGFDAFLTLWEPRLLAVLPARLHGEFHRRSRHALLRRDLQALGLARGPTDAWVEGVASIPLDGIDAAFGSLYVLEGSALGGRVIARHLAERHGFGADNGAAYFIGWGADTGRLWREFLRRMTDEVEEGTTARAAACAAALATFEVLVSGFGRDPGPAPEEK